MTLLSLKLPDLCIEDIHNVANKHITGSTDEDSGHTVHCYSKGAFFDGHKNPEVWNHPLRNIRGVVTDPLGKVVCRGLPKFFNYGEPLAETWDEGRVVLVEKFNGFCAHIWYDFENELWRYTTKAGIAHDFEGYIAELMEKKQLRGFPKNVRNISDLDPNIVYICEAIHPEDPHTIPTPSGLYLLARINRSNWTMYVDITNFPGEVHVVDAKEDALALQNTAQHEGYVAYHISSTKARSAPYRITSIMKLKTDYYWKLRQAKNPDKAYAFKKTFRVAISEHAVEPDEEYLLSVLGEHYDDWYAYHKDTIKDVLDAMNEELWEVHRVLNNVSDHNDRKAVVQSVQEAGVSLGLAMAVYDAKGTHMLKYFNGKLKEML